MYDLEWNEKLYYLEKLDVLIVYEVENEKLKLFGEINERFMEIEFYFFLD